MINQGARFAGCVKYIPDVSLTKNEAETCADVDPSLASGHQHRLDLSKCDQLGHCLDFADHMYVKFLLPFGLLGTFDLT